MTSLRSLPTALFLLTWVLAGACGPETVRVTSAPTTVAPTTAAPTATPTRTPTAAPSTAAPTPSRTATPTPTTSPGGTPNASCATLTGGSPIASSVLTTIRAAHNPGFDRLVFEWSGAAVPQYEIKVASTFIAPSGQAVRVDGNAFFSVRMNGQAHTDAGARSYAQGDPFRPGLPLIREIKLVEDFEGVVIFGVGLERLACPTVLTLLSPTRIVVDFPTPP
jgi:hypothetical protein